ncbi:hypothetical protein PLANTIT3_110007 [Plantibacter sp. T3]|nr:hypothetical protein PLANTIT3_110007 [Plantibacter sp. T3]
MTAGHPGHRVLGRAHGCSPSLKSRYPIGVLSGEHHTPRWYSVKERDGALQHARATKLRRTQPPRQNRTWHLLPNRSVTTRMTLAVTDVLMQIRHRCPAT